MPLPSSQSNIILHAGGPKTGSSSIQRTFHPRNSQISSQILSCLPFRMMTRISSASDFRPECNQCINLDLIWGKQVDEVSICKWKQDLRRQIRGSAGPTETYVFSAERAGAPQIDKLKCSQLAALIESIGLVPKVIYYARPLLGLCLSLGLQQLKAFAIRPISGRLFSRIGKISPTHIIDKYTYFRECYPDAIIDFRTFIRCQLEGSDVRLDFAAQLGTPTELLELLGIELLAQPSINESIDLPVL